jgi:DNA-binding CsgD family transcriptional regulator
METDDVLILDLYYDAMHASLSTLSEVWFRRLKKSLHFDSGGIADCAVGLRGDLTMESVQLHATSLDRFHDRTEMVGEERVEHGETPKSKDVLLQSAFVNPGISAVIDIGATFTDPHVLAYCKKYETAHALALIATTPIPTQFCGMTLWRADKRRPYSLPDKALATRLLSHVLQARQVSKRLPSAASVVPCENASVLCDPHGHLYFPSPAVVALFQLEWQQWEPPRLPEALLRELQIANHRGYCGRTVDIRAHRDGAMIKLSVVRKQPLAALTPAEQEVARRAARGLQYKEIARELAISPATVRNHLHAVYRKLDVRNKTALGQLLQAQGSLA